MVNIFGFLRRNGKGAPAPKVEGNIPTVAAPPIPEGGVTTEAPKAGWVKQAEAQAPAQREVIEQTAVGQLKEQAAGQAPTPLATPEASFRSGVAEVAKEQHIAAGTWGANKATSDEAPTGENKG